MSVLSSYCRVMAETKRHLELKSQAIEWLRDQGCDAWATEVRLPLSNYRVDVAGYRSRRRLDGLVGTTYAIECKQSRADFLKDAGLESSVREETGELADRVEALRRLMGMHLPECRMNRSLFLEYDSFDFGNWRHEGWARAARRLERLERQLGQGVKFSKIARYACANACVLFVGKGVVADVSEIPMGWGCVECSEGVRSVLREPLRLESRSEARLRLLERIASKGKG